MTAKNCPEDLHVLAPRVFSERQPLTLDDSIAHHCRQPTAHAMVVGTRRKRHGYHTEENPKFHTSDFTSDQFIGKARSEARGERVEPMKDETEAVRALRQDSTDC